MFYRYLSENLTEYINKGERRAGDSEFDYAKISDEEANEWRDELIESKGFFILPGELFCNVVAKADKNADLNETLEGIFQNIEKSAQGTPGEAEFSGLFEDFDVSTKKLGEEIADRNKRLTALLQGVASMNLGSSFQEHNVDAFGDAYEYLMTMYASAAGKSGGEFFTPPEVSMLLTRLGTLRRKEIRKVYDPACGSGSLLLKAAKILGVEHVGGFYGQEINRTTYNLCRINMFLHDIPFDKFDIACGDTLIKPRHGDVEPFDLIVSNPPYSLKWEGKSNPLLINDSRYSQAGVLAPKGYADYAFILHSISWLDGDGTAAIVCFPGTMHRGGAEQKIRKYLIENNYIASIIQLPTNLFYGTSIPTCIMVLKKSIKDNKILFIDASAEFVKQTNQNKLTPRNIENIVRAYADRTDKKHFAHLASHEEVREHNYDLRVPLYVQPPDMREKIDIIKLNAEISDIVVREQVLREEIDKIIAEIEGGECHE